MEREKEVKALQDLLARQRAAFMGDMWPDRATRDDRLRRLLALVERNADAMVAAAAADFGHRSAHVTRLADVMMVETAVRHARRHLRRWMRTRRVPTSIAFFPGRSRLMPQPLGVVGIVAPWNYPFQLALGPAAAALAAGNRVLVKPSELTPRCSALLQSMVAESFAPEEMAVVTGDAQVGRAFVELKFDHLLFTGSTAVGREVALAAAANLTPVTLELGGKSPAILAADCDLERAARSIALGKLFNAGQTCIAPDYALVPRGMVDGFVAAMGRAVQQLYPRHGRNADCTSIVNARHHERLQGLLDDARRQGATLFPLALEGGEPPAMPRLLGPTLVLDCQPGMAILRDEIFGPLLPVVPYDDLDAALAHVNRGERPLALYWFGRNAAQRERVLRGTHAGGVTVNDCMWHFAQEDLPFGGVGASGSGAYHGEAGFRTFSKDKPVFHQGSLTGTTLLLPPYGKAFDLVARLLKVVM